MGHSMEPRNAADRDAATAAGFERADRRDSDRTGTRRGRPRATVTVTVTGTVTVTRCSCLDVPGPAARPAGPEQTCQ